MDFYRRRPSWNGCRFRGDMDHTPFERLLENHPGIDRTVVKIISFYQGKAQALGGDDLTRQVQNMGYRGVDNRDVREVIHGLRRQGYLICALPGSSGGYYMATDQEEFDEFARREFEGKISDMSTTLSAMRHAARERWGDAYQRSLF